MKLEFSIYIPKRRAVDNHEAPTITFGLGNMIDKNKYIPVVDIDKKLDHAQLVNIMKTGWNIFGFCGYIIMNTKKGHHIIWETTIEWKTLNRLWTKLKYILDHKWISLQRKRGYAVLRVRGKYRENDICIQEQHLFMKNELFNKWYKLYSRLVGERFCQQSH